MEYNFYLEQKYLYGGRVEARILIAAQAEALGYEDDFRRSAAGHKLYVDGFNSVEAIHCQRQSEIVRKRRRNFVDFRRGG